MIPSIVVSMWTVLHKLTSLPCVDILGGEHSQWKKCVIGGTDFKDLYAVFSLFPDCRHNVITSPMLSAISASLTWWAVYFLELWAT